MSPNLNTDGSKSVGGTLLNEFQDAETKVDAGTSESVQSQLLAAVQQLSKQTSTRTARVKEMETRGKAGRKAHLNMCYRHTMRQLRDEQEANPGWYSAVSAAQREFKTSLKQKDRDRGSMGDRKRLSAGPPKPFAHGVSLGDASEQQLEFLEEEKQSYRRTGAWARATWRSLVSGAFPRAEPQYQQIDLKDGRHMIGIQQTNQFGKFDLRGDLMQCLALPFCVDLREGGAGAGGVRSGSAGLERPGGAAEAAPGKQAALVACQPTVWGAGEAGSRHMSKGAAVYGSPLGALRQQCRSSAGAGEGDQGSASAGNRVQREEGGVGAPAHRFLPFNLGGNPQSRELALGF
ncbi:hypothetical protein CYMTET_27852 [Cymbomonas tetramitiformis]|uniref:Uncharacterized protein n=1 Tax=Cymbomonas tetramitiformis TaxID=36881 RepID=A0AAE0FP39_9CHLO|nr:hypothetical protein CYMTET_27852 [Cymbomonas tetramitiformis]